MLWDVHKRQKTGPPEERGQRWPGDQMPGTRRPGQQPQPGGLEEEEMSFGSQIPESGCHTQDVEPDQVSSLGRKQFNFQNQISSLRIYSFNVEYPVEKCASISTLYLICSILAH